MKISNISENHTNSMEDKLDGIWNYKTTILYCDIFLEKQILRPTFYQGRITLTPQKTTRMYKCSRMKYGQRDK